MKHPDGGTKEEQTTLLDQNARFVPEPTMVFCVRQEDGEERGRRGWHVQAGLGSGRSQAFLPLPASQLSLTSSFKDKRARTEERGLGDH